MQTLYKFLKLASIFYSTLFVIAVNYTIVSALRYILSGTTTETGQFYFNAALGGLGGLVAILLACWIAIDTLKSQRRARDEKPDTDHTV